MQKKEIKFEHKSVLLKQVIDHLAPKSGGIYFDGTLGGAGYAEAILEASGPDGVLVGVDIDDLAISASRSRLERFGSRAKIVRDSYANVLKIANDLGVKFDGAVLDLGISSPQVDAAERGFSFSKDAPLDMRMDRRLAATAAEIVNSCGQDELADIFDRLGEERFASKIARAIVLKREASPIATTAQLEEICWVAYPPKFRHGRTHPATKVFQALRIAVNRELENLEKFLGDICKSLNQGGRVVIVSFHSLEDRIVKNAAKAMNISGEVEILTKKPVEADELETEDNPRSRSAKLRAFIKR